jgi:hypothetical protein
MPHRTSFCLLWCSLYIASIIKMSERWRTITTRQGGDGADTLGYNLGAALGAIHFKEHLPKSAVGDVVKAPR